MDSGPAGANADDFMCSDPSGRGMCCVIRRQSAAMDDTQAQALIERLLLSAHAVERDIATLLRPAAISEPQAAFRRARYQRKTDVARRVHAAYDERIERATTNETLTPHGYLGLAMVFLDAARVEAGSVESSRACILGWANSAFNALDHAAASDGLSALVADLRNELDAHCRRGVSG